MTWLARFWAVLDARNKEFFRDTSSLAWNFLFPFIVVLGFAFAFSGGSQDLFKVAFHKLSPELSEPAFLKTQYVQFIPTDHLDESLKKLQRHQLDMVLSLEPNTFRYWINESSPKGYLLQKILTGTPLDHSLKLEKQTVEGKEIRYVDWLISGLLAMNMMFSALFGVGYTIVRYRKNGVLKRLKATPLSAFIFLSAQVASRLVLILFVTAIVYLGCHVLVHFQMLGSYWNLALVLTMGAVCLISLSLLIASRVRSEEFAGGLLNLISWPMMFLSGVWFSLEGAHPWVKKSALIFPLTHVINAARAIMTEGAGLAAVLPNITVLAVMSVVFLAVGSLTFKWD